MRYEGAGGKAEAGPRIHGGDLENVAEGAERQDLIRNPAAKVSASARIPRAQASRVGISVTAP